MLEPFATLAFVATLWLIAKLVVETIDESGGRIAAALSGRQYKAETTIPALPVRVSWRRSAARPLRAQPLQWRAAA